jgi:hypothetical protein
MLVIQVTTVDPVMTATTESVEVKTNPSTIEDGTMENRFSNPDM